MKGAFSTVHIGGDGSADRFFPSFRPNIERYLPQSIQNADGLTVFPGFCDVHVHFREPGFSYKETIRTGSLAAAAGGYTTVLTMPNLDPVPDSVENIAKELEIIKRDAVVDVVPYASITAGERGEELSDIEGLAGLCAAFSDDGKGVSREDLMEEAFLRTKALGKILACHCEDLSLVNGGYVHDGEYARLHGHAGICSESEWGPILRDIGILRKTGGSYHVCHVSCKESVEIIREAKKEGLDVTCETAPHYLLLDDGDLREEGRFKMNPPLRSRGDRLALIEGIKDGTVDMIATDHAPHSREEKSKGLRGSAFGITGLETAFPMLYTYLVKEKIITLEKLIELMAVNPRKRFGLPLEKAGFTVFDLNEKYRIDPDRFLSMGRATPFEGREVYGRCVLTVCGGKAVYERQDPFSKD
ncbi:MAG: dihydroorotase [Clostridia bacterium]|nr:dihydroorotase [Clostridia bacterium]